MTSMIIITYLVLVCYLIMMIFFILHWNRNNKIESIKSSSVSVSIVIPTRNEEDTILNCLLSITKQNYLVSLLEIIVVDDHSSDSTLALVQEFAKNAEIKIKTLSLPPELKGKKAALALAIHQATGKIIISRDADTQCESADWLSKMVAPLIDDKVKMNVGPVGLIGNGGFLTEFQIIENLGLQLTSGGSIASHHPLFCSAANLAYKKADFETLGNDPFNTKIASGDDVFLMNRFKKTFGAKSIVFSKDKEAIVTTKAAADLTIFLNQRARWAGKFFNNSNPSHYVVGLIIALMNIFMIFSLVSSFFFTQWCFIFAVLAFSRFIIDFLLVFLSASFFGQKQSLWWYFPCFLFNPIYVMLVLAFSVLKKPIWKERITVGKE